MSSTLTLMKQGDDIALASEPNSRVEPLSVLYARPTQHLPKLSNKSLRIPCVEPILTSSPWGTTYQNEIFEPSSDNIRSLLVIALRSGPLMWRRCSGILLPWGSWISSSFEELKLSCLGHVCLSALREVDLSTRWWNKSSRLDRA